MLNVINSKWIGRIIHACILFCAFTASGQTASKPNVILIITDDQGYGDIAAHGNPVIKTPNLDTLHSQSVRLTDYHVDPTCSPTRAALMTGRYSIRTGVWHTILGRSMMAGNEFTLAEAFKHNGYKTGHFGKWHLGDNFPCRPQDQGFDHVFMHLGGGVGQGPDYFGNDYFDDTYLLNGQYTKQEGYCTDVWFDHALAFIEQQKNEQAPFFCYLSTNAPHGPLFVPDEDANPYRNHEVDIEKNMANFYGMITNIDDNLGRLMTYLDENGLSENTILIFTTDNGTGNGNTPRYKGFKGFNANMRAQKGSEYDGGHRVPFFIRWPAGGIAGDTNSARDISVLTAHIDVLPTLTELCELQINDHLPWDGVSLAGAMLGKAEPPTDRTLMVHSQRIEWPEKWRKSSVMTQRWRLVNGRELYDIQADPGQRNNIAQAHPQVVAQLREHYETLWADLEAGFDDVPLVLGDLRGNPTTLMSHDWHMEPSKEQSLWHQNHIRSDAKKNGYWIVEVVHAGEYEVTLRRRPAEAPAPIQATHASITLGDTKLVDQDIDPQNPTPTFRVTLPKGEAKLSSTLTNAQGQQWGAYYLEVKRLEE